MGHLNQPGFAPMASTPIDMPHRANQGVQYQLRFDSSPLAEAAMR